MEKEKWMKMGTEAAEYVADNLLGAQIWYKPLKSAVKWMFEKDSFVKPYQCALEVYKRRYGEDWLWAAFQYTDKLEKKLKDIFLNDAGSRELRYKLEVLLDKTVGEGSGKEKTISAEQQQFFIEQLIMALTMTKEFQEKMIKCRADEEREFLVEQAEADEARQEEMFHRQEQIWRRQEEWLRSIYQQERFNGEKSQLLLEIINGWENERTELTGNVDETVNRQPEKKLLSEAEKKRKKYADEYTKEMFFHDKGSKVTLKNLYVLPDYEKKDKEDGKNLLDIIADFIHSPGSAAKNKNPFLFIEGYAGIGKSSLVSKLAYLYECGSDEEKSIFDGRQLFCVRLRELVQPGEHVDIENPLRDIGKYLGFLPRDCQGEKESCLEESQSQCDNCREDMLRKLDRAILILDGFGELCMAESIAYAEKELYFKQLNGWLKEEKCNCKVIITTRLQHIDYKKLSSDSDKWTGNKGYGFSELKCPFERITLSWFGREKKNEWIKNYEKADVSLNLSIKQGILKMEGTDYEAICGTPFMLYLIAIGNISISKEMEIWEIYHQVFSREIPNRDYDKGRKGNPSRLHHNHLYELTGDIAFALYKKGNTFALSHREVEEVISDYVSEVKRKDRQEGVCGQESDVESGELERVLKECYGLNVYLKENKENGGVEFFHNNIRDFFLCEKISRELNSCYGRCTGESEQHIDEMIRCFDSVFSFHVMGDKVRQFILSRMRWKKKKKEGGSVLPDAWFERERKDQFFRKVLTDMLIYGFAYPGFYRRRQEENGLKCMINEFQNLCGIYWEIYWEFIEEKRREGKETDDEKVQLFDTERVKEINDADILNVLMGKCKKRNGYAGKDKINIHFSSIDLSRVDLSRVNLMGACFRLADLHGTNLSFADLRKAVFYKAGLSNANLQGAKLNRADFSYGDLKKVNLYEADMRKANLFYADLRGACLNEAKLDRADFTGVKIGQIKDYFIPEVIGVLKKANLREADWTGVPEKIKEQLLS